MGLKMLLTTYELVGIRPPLFVCKLSLWLLKPLGDIQEPKAVDEESGDVMAVAEDEKNLHDEVRVSPRNSTTEI